MDNPQKIYLLGAASGRGARDQRCSDGPITIRNSTIFQQLQRKIPNMQWDKILEARENIEALAAIHDVCENLACRTFEIVRNKERFIVFGGDHSCAIGTWSGVYGAVKPEGRMGLLWIDAHMDGHTDETTPSGNIHGMPVACLLGYGVSTLTQLHTTEAKVLPTDICIIGARSFEKGEEELLRRLDVRIFYMEEIHERSIVAVMKEAYQIVNQHTVGYGISIDLDAIDPEDVPGVGSPEPGGIRAQELINALHGLGNDPKLIGMEIAEFNPHKDKNRSTEKVITYLIQSILDPRNIS